MDGTESKRRWFCPTPGSLVILSLAVTGILFFSQRFQWFGFNHNKGWTVLIVVASVGVVLVLVLLWWILALVFRLRFQFSIRSLLVLVIAVQRYQIVAIVLKELMGHRVPEQVGMHLNAGDGRILIAQ